MSAEERFEALARDLVEPLRRFLVRRTDPETAQDALAETLLVCWRRLDEVPENALPWAYAVARNCLANALRSERRQARLAARVAVVDPPDEVQPGPDGVRDHTDGADGVDGTDELTAALGRLSEQDAELLRLWAWEQLGTAEIAEVLEISANAAGVRLHRARTRLRAELGKTERGAGHERVGEETQP